MSKSSSSLILYFNLLSQPSRTLKIFLDVNKIPYTPRVLKLEQGEHLQDEYALINPLKKIPVIRHNDFILRESVGIVRYLCREFNVAGHWYPSDSRQQARVDEFLEWHHIDLRAPCALYFQYKYLRPLLSGKLPNEDRIKVIYKQMVEACDKVENVWLKDGNKFLCGDLITVADLFGACELEQPRIAGYDPRTGRPKLKSWMDRIETEVRPHYSLAHELINSMITNNQQAEKHTSKL